MSPTPRRAEVTKSWKLYVAGQFARSESRRTMPAQDRRGRLLGRLERASREDLEAAVAAARRATGSWSRRSAASRGAQLYRMAEVLEARSADFTAALAATGSGGRRAAARETAAAADRLVCFAGWSDKFQQLLGSRNPVAGPYHNFTMPEAAGVAGVIAPDEPPLLGLVSLLAPPLCAGNTVVALGSGAHPLTTALFGEVCAAAELPHGVLNLLTGRRGELAEAFAEHRDLDALHAAGCGRAERRRLEEIAARRLQRVAVRDLQGADWLEARPCEGVEWIEDFVTMKTVWHPASA